MAKACGVPNVVSVSAKDIAAVEKVLRAELQKDGVSVIIAKEPCKLIEKSKHPVFRITEVCKNCKACVKLGCPAIINGEKAPTIDPSVCTGCGLCAQVCKFGAISEENR